LAVLGLAVRVEQADQPGLRAALSGPGGQLVLIS